MALAAGTVVVNTSTGGEIKTGMAAAIYDAMFASGATVYLPLGGGGSEHPGVWHKRAELAKMANAIAIGVVAHLAANGYP